MATGNPFPNVPDVAGVYGAPAAPNTNALAGAGAAGHKTRTAAMVAAALQGIKAGYQKNYLKQYDALQNQYLQARANYDLNKSAIDDAVKQNADPNSPELQTYKANMDAAYSNVQKLSNEIITKYGGQGKGKGKGGGQDGQDNWREKVGETLHNILLGKPVNLGELKQYQQPGKGPNPGGAGTAPMFPQQGVDTGNPPMAPNPPANG